MLVRKYLPDFNVPVINFVSVSSIAGDKLMIIRVSYLVNSDNTFF